MRKRLRKGSKEARAFMAQLRGMRGKRKARAVKDDLAYRRATARAFSMGARLKHRKTAKRLRAMQARTSPRLRYGAPKSRLVRGKRNPRRLTQKHGGGWKTKRRKMRKVPFHCVSFKGHKGGKRFYFCTDQRDGKTVSFLSTSKAAAKHFPSEDAALKAAKEIAKNHAVRAKFRSILVT